MRSTIIFIVCALLNLALVQSFPSNSDCDRHITAVNAKSGDIFSPGYPNNYAHSSLCNYVIQTPSSSNHITIDFKVFRLEEHNSCNFDYVAIYDGPSDQSELIGKYCGFDKPPIFTSSGRFVTVQFASDETVNEMGFQLEYSVGCSSSFSSTSGVINSPGYPSNYPDMTDCSYHVQPTDGSQLLFTFTYFNVEESDNCEFDYLEISSGKKSKYSQRICGNKPVFKALYNGTEVNLHFVSDESVSRTGFNIEYKTTTSCSDDNGGCDRGCVDIGKGKVRCTCPDGYYLDENGVLCQDIDECQSSPCSEACTNTPGSFFCSCTSKGFSLAPDGVSCSDMTCMENNGGCEQICQPVGSSSYICACHLGYKLKADKHNCTDIDECNSVDPNHQNTCEQVCYNQPGSYYCGCGEGFQLSDNARSCEDLIECPQHEDECSYRCRDTLGGWECYCEEGFKPDEIISGDCKDIDECSENLAPAVCLSCTNYPGGYDCQCPEGYDTSDYGTNCTDINECSTKNGGCTQLCVNLPGGYKCACEEGFVPPFNGSSVCEDINECMPNNGNGPCQHYCENLQGSFECSCMFGYELSDDLMACHDINECLNSDCQQACVNTAGSYHCKCYSGYTFDKSGVCQDVDECLTNPCTSHESSVCTNTIGGYTCSCPDGFDVINGTECVDIDECSDTDICVQICVNTPGSYNCKCETGYAQINDMCVDINECDTNPCQHRCVNQIGSFDCDCDEGYFLLADKRNCSDVDECAEGIDNCEQVCLNQIGNHTCTCEPGYTLNDDGFTCTDVDECLIDNGGCSNGCLNLIGSYFCHCPAGFKVKSDNKTCEDIDECADNNGGCSHVCTNTEGSFSCDCHEGFMANGTFDCVDINECEVNNGNCSQNCNNFKGSYNCSCQDNFELNEDNLTCSICPKCSEFRSLQSTVSQLMEFKSSGDAIFDSIKRLTATVIELQNKVAILEGAVGNF